MACYGLISSLIIIQNGNGKMRRSWKRNWLKSVRMAIKQFWSFEAPRPGRKNTMGTLAGQCDQIKLPILRILLKETVKRYSVAPYFVQYYEFWNEPDADHLGLDPDSIFGGWGDPSDSNYYGGGYYGQMLSQVYPAVKSANSSAQVLIGGLLLYCDPTDNSIPRACPTDDKMLPPKFFEGILKNNGGAYFDIVNFHGYPYKHLENSNPILLEKNFKPWKSRGGVVKGKIDFLREVMSKYGVVKPIFQSEAGLMADNPAIPGFERSKADYLVWVYTRNISEKLLGTTWYTLNGPGWNNSGLLDANQAPLPAYQAMKFAIQELNGAAYSVPVNSYPGVIGFEFKKGATRIQVVFPADDYNILPLLSLPTGFHAAYDTFGDAITPVNNTLTIDHAVYIELMP